MIKRVNKSKKSKQGAILVIVVLILALAMIFIASAMMLTQATRRRLYSTAIQSQARLTVTAASEVFLEALKMQEITDTQLESIMGKTHGAGKTKVKMVVDGIPGMSTSADNCTWLDIYQDPTDASFVYCDFTTVIGDTTENVQVVLKADSSDPVFGSQFKNQVEVAGGVGIGELRFTNGCGMWDSSKISRPTDNNIVLRGNYHGQTSGSKYFSDVVFGQDSTDIKLGGGEMFYGKLVFLQGAQMNGRSSAQVYGDIYLIGKDNSAGLALKDPSQPGLWDDLKNQNFVFSGRSVQNDTGDQNHKVRDAVKNSTNKVYFVDANGNSLGSSHTNMTGKSQNGDTYTVTNAAESGSLSGMSSFVKRYQSWNYSSTSNPFPSAASVFSKLCPDGDVLTSDGTVTLNYDTYSPTGEFFQHGQAIGNGKKYIVHPVTTSYPAYKKDADGKPEKYLYLNSETSSRYIEPGYYYVTSTTGAASVTGGGESYRYDPIVLAIDGSRGDEYRFYFASGTAFTLRGLIFAVYNADSTKPVLFILENGAKVQLSHNNDGLDSSKANLCSAGFLSVSTRPGCDSATNVINYVKTHNWASEAKTVTNSDYKNHSGQLGSVQYSKYYDNIVRPAMFIYGVGNNVICLGKSVNIEAYIGLYGNSSFGPIDGSGDHQQLYGRIECQSFHTYKQEGQFVVAGSDNPVGDFSMPYCPQPISASNIPKQRLAVSKYSVADIIYYYDGSTPP
jgi:hypothetical protein